MLLHLETTEIKDNVILFKLPYICIDSNKKYTISVREFYLKHQPAVKGGPYLFSLCSTLLLDKATNSQEILSCMLLPKQKHTYVTRHSNPLEYKITCSDFETSQFFFVPREKGTYLSDYKINYIKIILEIKEY